MPFITSEGYCWNGPLHDVGEYVPGRTEPSEEDTPPHSETHYIADLPTCLTAHDHYIDNCKPIQIGDLTNEIHPLFKQTNFPGVDYATLLHSLRLASLLIDTDCLLDYWHARWYGPSKKEYTGDGEDDCI